MYDQFNMSMKGGYMALRDAMKVLSTVHARFVVLQECDQSNISRNSSSQHSQRNRRMLAQKSPFSLQQLLSPRPPCEKTDSSHIDLASSCRSDAGSTLWQRYKKFLPSAA